MRRLILWRGDGGMAPQEGGGREGRGGERLVLLVLPPGH